MILTFFHSFSSPRLGPNSHALFGHEGVKQRQQVTPVKPGGIGNGGEEDKYGRGVVGRCERMNGDKEVKGNGEGRCGGKIILAQSLPDLS